MLPEWARKAFGGQSDDALSRMAERESARREVENTRWYRMVGERLEQELAWTQAELRRVSVFHFERLQAYADALEVVTAFVKVTEKNGNMASELLSERVAKNKRKTVDEHMDEILGVRE